MREPVVAGMFYPGSEKGLRKELKDCFVRGPGREGRREGPKVKGLVSPHAGYTYSGATAAFGYLALLDGGLPKTAVVIGPNHTGLGAPVGLAFDDFRTPMGTMELDKPLAEAIGVEKDRTSHAHEHSMEVQLPFLQYIGRGIQQVCISMLDQSLGSARALGRKVAKGIKAVGRDAVVVASSDFTHCGRNYGYPVPPDMNAGEFARSRDMPVIEELLKMDLERAFERTEELGCTACGMGPIAAMMTAVKEMGGGLPKLLNYSTSYDVMPERSAVGYASIALF